MKSIWLQMRVNKGRRGNILTRVEDLEVKQRQKIFHNTSIVRVSDLTDDLGEIVAGRFTALGAGATETEPTGTGFIGSFMDGDGVEFSDGTVLNVGSAKNGNYAAGFNNDGDFVAANNEYKINEEGTFSNGLTFLHRFEATYGGVTRQAYLGMTVPDGQSQPSFRIYYNEPAATNLVLNGSFESADETSWTDTNTAWVVEADGTFGYAARHDGTDTGCPPTLTQSIAVSASTVYAFQFYGKMASGFFPASVSLIWKDGGASTIRTDTIIASDSASWVLKSGIYTSPSTAATVTISVHSGEIFTDCYVTGFELYALTSYSAIDFYDSKIIANAYPDKPVNLLGLPESALIFASEAVWSASGANSIAATSQRFNTVMRASAANSNDGATVDFSFVVKAGTYTLTVLAVKDNDAGKIDGYLDGSASTSWTGDDLYNASTSYNADFSHSVTFTTGGRHTLRLKVNGKNAASSDYRTYLTCVYLTPSSVSVEA